MGITPALDTRPTVGLIPYNAARLEGHIIDPSVSLPSETYYQYDTVCLIYGRESSAHTHGATRTTSTRIPAGRKSSLSLAV